MLEPGVGHTLHGGRLWGLLGLVMLLEARNQIGFVPSDRKLLFLEKLLELWDLERGVFGHGSELADDDGDEEEVVDAR